MINYPPKPWHDGQTFIHESSSGNKSKGTYHEDKQGWSFSPLNEDGQTGDGTITTLTVKTINQRPTVTRDPFDIDSSSFQPTNQNDVNWYLYDLIVDNNQTITSINAGNVLQGPEELPFFSKEETRRNRPHIIQGSQQETNYTLFDLIKNNPYNVWVGEDPPGEEIEETYQFWWHTERLELLFNYNDQWWPVSIPPDQRQALTEVIEGLEVSVTKVRGDVAKNKIDIDELRQDIIDGEFRPNLKQVLDKGNIADKNIFLTNAEDDLIDLSVTEKRIVMGSVGEETVPKFELRHKNEEHTSLAAFEIDEKGTRLDFEAEGKIDNMHFRFQNDDKLILNKTGDAVFSGKVQGVPGTQNNEFVTYGQLLTVEEELEQLAPSLERGTWEYTSDPDPGPGKYTLIKEMLSPEAQQTICDLEFTDCLINAGTDPTAASNCNRDKEACDLAIDPEGKIVTTDKFAEADQILFNPIDSEGVEHEFGGIDDDHLLDLFNEDDDAFGVFDIVTHGSGLFDVDVLSTRGTAVGLARLKIFKHEGSVDFDQYVRKQGDQMSGTLEIMTDTTAGYGIKIGKRSNGGSNLMLHTDGRIDCYAPSFGPQHLVNKQYVDDAIAKAAPARYRWIYRTWGPGGPGALLSRNTMIQNGDTIYLSATTADGFSFYRRKNSVIFDSGSNKPLITIWDYDGGYRHKFTATVSKVAQDKDGDFEIKISSMVGADNLNLTLDEPHWITISGIF